MTGLLWLTATYGALFLYLTRTPGSRLWWSSLLVLTVAAARGTCRLVSDLGDGGHGPWWSWALALLLDAALAYLIYRVARRINRRRPATPDQLRS